MFYDEFTISAAWVSAILVSVFAGVFYALGAEYLNKHMIIFFPEVGNDAVTGEEEARLRGEWSHLRLVWPKKEVKKAA